MPREQTHGQLLLTLSGTIASVEKDQDKARAWGHHGEAEFGAEGRHHHEPRVAHPCSRIRWVPSTPSAVG